MLKISNLVSIPDDEIQLSAIRAQGAGGQNVNKLATAVHLRFDIRASSLPDYYKQRLLARRDNRITRNGVIVFKSQNHRTQARNRQAAYDRLVELIRKAILRPKKRKATKPSRNVLRKRLDDKIRHGRKKALRRKI